MNDCKKFNETLLPEKFNVYSHLNMEDITDARLQALEKNLQRFWNKKIGEYHDLYVQNDILLLADVFDNFRNKCL